MLLNALRALSQKQTLSAVDFEQAFKQRTNSMVSYVNALMQIFLNEQIYVETNGGWCWAN